MKIAIVAATMKGGDPAKVQHQWTTDCLPGKIVEDMFPAVMRRKTETDEIPVEDLMVDRTPACPLMIRAQIDQKQRVGVIGRTAAILIVAERKTRNDVIGVEVETVTVIRDGETEAERKGGVEVEVEVEKAVLTTTARLKDKKGPDRGTIETVARNIVHETIEETDVIDIASEIAGVTNRTGIGQDLHVG